MALTIDSSLFLAGDRAGLSDGIIMELAASLGGVIDFALDPRRGDEIVILFEENYLDGEKFSDGDIVAASFNNNGRLVEAYRYTDSLGDTGYFDAEGVSMRKAFLKAPSTSHESVQASIQIACTQSTRPSAPTEERTTLPQEARQSMQREMAV